MRVRSAAPADRPALLLVVGAAGAASAQTQLGGVNVEGGDRGRRAVLPRFAPLAEGSGEVRGIPGHEPRALPASGLNLRLSRPDESLFGEFGGSKWGFTDQDYYLSVGRLGDLAVRLPVGPDASRHLHHGESSSRPSRSPGIFVLPTPRPAVDRPQQRSGSRRDRRALGQGADALCLQRVAEPRLRRRVHPDPQVRRQADGHGLREPRRQLLRGAPAHRSDRARLSDSRRLRGPADSRSSSPTACPSSRTISTASRRTTRASATARPAARARRAAPRRGRARFPRATWRTR